MLRRHRFVHITIISIVSIHVVTLHSHHTFVDSFITFAYNIYFMLYNLNRNNNLLKKKKIYNMRVIIVIISVVYLSKTNTNKMSVFLKTCLTTILDSE